MAEEVADIALCFSMDWDLRKLLSYQLCEHVCFIFPALKKMQLGTERRKPRKLLTEFDGLTASPLVIKAHRLHMPTYTLLDSKLLDCKTVMKMSVTGSGLVRTVVDLFLPPPFHRFYIMLWKFDIYFFLGWPDVLSSSAK